MANRCEGDSRPDEGVQIEAENIEQLVVKR
jgi:hypothetical protein